MEKLEKSLLEQELAKARKRLSALEVSVEQCQKTIDYAVKNKLKSLEKDALIRISRYRMNVVNAQGLVEDLEKASGALPLK